MLDTRERRYANTVYPGGDKHALRTSCCAVATFALLVVLVVLVVLGVACIVKKSVLERAGGITTEPQPQRSELLEGGE